MHDFPALDRTALSVVSLHEESGDVAYWLSQPPEERWRALELMRQLLYGYSDPPPRLQRVLTVVDREER